MKAAFILRLGLAIVFLLFGLKKLYAPGQTTAEIQLLLNWKLMNAAALNFYLGLSEIIIAVSFFSGYKVRITSLASAFLLTLFFLSFLVKYGLSINPDLYRDIGLLGASVSLFLLGGGYLSLDEYFAKQIKQKKNE
ncbi:MAG: DoxX family protein [Candidatus Paceibacteria bacterium]